MKSRFTLPSDLTASRRSPASDSILVRPVAPRAISVAHRFELKHNASPRFARRRQERRQGQALLLAVLIMLLAALLGASFLAVVSGNLNQSARIADKTRAIEASRAGIAYANAQISTSSQGDLWRPIDVSPVPAPGAANYDFYYSQLDKVQGWANNLIPPQETDPFPNASYPVDTYAEAVAYYRNRTYSKFPAPDQAIGDAPKFLVKVEEVPVLRPSDAGYNAEEAKHAGEIKITSIGLSDDDPNVFHRSVAYKEGRRKSPWASALRSISNWKFNANDGRGGVPFSEVAGPVSVTGATANVDVPVSDVTAFSNDDAPFNVVIVRKDANNATNSSVRGAVVTKVTLPVAAGNPATLTLARFDTPIIGDETVQKAAAIGTGSTIDLLNTGQLPAPAFPLQPQSRGILANGSMWLQGQIQLSDLNKFGTKIFSSGAIALDSASKPVVAPGTLPNPNYGIAGNGTLVSSNTNGFPGNFTTDSGVGVVPTDIVNDGWDKIDAQTLGLDYSPSRNDKLLARDVKPFEPVKIDSAENLARYRALTRNSDSIPYAGGNFYPAGVFIDNRDDVEKVGTTPMTQAQLVNMLTAPKSTPAANYARNDATATAATGVSLEQRHLRGWVGPDEFLARGALIEITNDAYPSLGIAAPSLRVTLDARSDTNPNGPDADKVWRKADGTPDNGVYTRVLPFPANGTIFAEGNVRIRGDVGNSGTPAPRSLTVISGGNIYIEGSLSIDNTFSTGTTPDPNRKKLMLLAKKNVIVNPTRAVLGRTDVQTVATNAAAIPVTGTTGNIANLTLPVANGITFNQGDYVLVEGQRIEGNPPVAVTKPLRGFVVTATDNQLTIRTADTGTANINAIVRSPLEARKEDDPANVQATYSLVDTENALNRRILVAVAQRQSGSNINIDNKLVFDHVGELKETTPGTPIGIQIKAEDVPPSGTFVAELTNKQPLDGTTQDNDNREKSITSPNKRLRTYNNFPTMTGATSNQKDFTFAANKTLAQLITEISAHTETSAGVNPTTYTYTATPNGGIGALPSYALAGVGLRYAPGATVFTTPPTAPAPVGPANNSREIFSTANGFTIPLATSVEFNLNGGLADFQTIGETRSIRYVGFNPAFGTSDDSLTVDRHFYQPVAAISTSSTLDVRTLTLPTTGAPAGFTTFPNSIVLKRTNAYSDANLSDLLPAYRVKAMKVESYASNSNDIKPSGGTMNINAFVYAQEGSWFIIPGDYFRSNSPVRADVDASGNFNGSYIDYANPGVPDANEYIVDGQSRKVADLNRNGVVDTGEYEAALHLTRYNSVKIEFFGSIVENQTAVVADVTVPGANIGDPLIVVQKGSVQDWMDKWVSYNDNRVAPILPPPGSSPGVRGARNNFSFVSYTYDPAIQDGRPGANQLRVPITDDLLYEQ